MCCDDQAGGQTVRSGWVGSEWCRRDDVRLGRGDHDSLGEPSARPFLDQADEVVGLEHAEVIIDLLAR
jgi:hypothetical protein